MLTITDQATGRVWVYFSRDKMRIVEKIKAWVVVAEAECRQYGKSEKVMALRLPPTALLLGPLLADRALVISAALIEFCWSACDGVNLGTR